MKRFFIVLSILILGFAGAASAQVNTGSISGNVTDNSGAAVVGANVSAKNVGTGEEHTAQSGAIGEYTLQGLPIGIWRVTVASPSFKTFAEQVEVTVGAAITVNAKLEVGAASTTVEVTASYGTEVNTQTQELSQLVNPEQVATLPSLNRNPYDFVVLSGNVSNGDNTNGSMDSGQSLSNRGVGYSINGQREAGTEILLDGVENVAVFGVNAGQLVPADSIEEFSIVTNNFGAEFGRASGGIVSVDTKSGTNDIHGSLFEYNRTSATTANTYANDAENAIADADVAPKGIYVRNDFGFNIGGPIIKNKLFAFFSEEFVRVRSASSQTEDVFDPAFIALLPANDQAYFSKFGTGVGSSSGSVTASQLNSACAFGSTSSSACVAPATLPNINGNPATPLPGATPVFDTVNFTAPFNAGGGTPQNTYNLLGRLDYNLSPKTQMFFRFARYSEDDFPGSSGYSPYSQYDVGQTSFDNSGLFSINHSLRDNLLSNTKVSFTRFNVANSFNTALTNTPNLYLQNGNAPQSDDPVTGNVIQLPGLQNSTDGNGGLPFGGPQNTLQLEEDLAWTKGRHTMRFGGQFTYIQLNVAYGAYQQAVEALGGDLQNSLLSLVNAGGITDPTTGAFASPIVEFDARVNGGVLPCNTDIYGNLIQTAACTVTPPLPQASPARSYRYKDWAVYAQDSFKITRKLTINYGLRYEHYGVQHNDIQSLDSNFVQGACGFPCNISTGNIEISPLSPGGQMWSPRWGTPAPRVGFAYDVFGDGKTSVRGGAGISYERNFGNVTYNASFNPPASAVVEVTCAADPNTGIVSQCPNLVTNNDLGPLGVAGSASQGLPPTELRDNQNNINVAQTQFWSLAVEHQLAHNTLLAVSYSGAHSVHLYDLANLNLIGAAQAWDGQPLVTTLAPGPGVVGAPAQQCPYPDFADSTMNACYTRLNNQYSNINVRGSNGVGTYNALNVKFQTQDLHKTGLTLVANYTWAHALDDLSDTFSGSEIQGSLGYTNPLHPQLDYGNSDYDIRHRFVLSPIWATPWFKNGRGFLTQALGGWTISGIFTARTGTPFSIYDVTDLINFYVIPRLTPASPITQYHTGKPVQALDQFGNPIANQYNALNVPASGVDGSAYNTALGLDDFGPFPADMTARNAFRGPGAWNLDAAIQKNFKLTERVGLEFRAEGFDVLNHHNFYVNGEDNYGAGGAFQVVEEKGGLGSQATGGNNDERRFMQFALRLTF